MGFFAKKKGSKVSTAASLSESEIHRKLYGEFESGTMREVSAEREPVKEPGPVPPPPSAKEARTAHDLFNVSTETTSETEIPARQNRPVIKSPENASRYVPLHEFEKKSAPGADTAHAQARSRSGDAAGKIKEKFSAIFPWIFARGRTLIVGVADPRRVMMRRIIYWSVVAGVVFLMFWGVNALNSQREKAMNTQYSSRREQPVGVENVSAPVQDAGVPVTERPVVITPAPVRPRVAERDVVITPAAQVKRTEVQAASSGSYAIQVVTYPSRADAEQVVEALKKEKLSAFVKENVRPSGRIFYVVHIGGYPTEEEAQAQLVKFRAKEVARPFQDAFVKTL